MSVGLTWYTLTAGRLQLPTTMVDVGAASPLNDRQLVPPCTFCGLACEWKEVRHLQSLRPTSAKEETAREDERAEEG